MEKRRPWRQRKGFFGKIAHIEEDWVTPTEYLPYIDALLGDIDLDPCTTYKANQEFIRAKTAYTLKEDGINIESPWFGTTYVFPPTYGRYSFKKETGKWRWAPRGGTGTSSPSVIWFKRLYKEWKLRNVSEALFFTVQPEMMRICPELWDLPVCMPAKRARLIHGKGLWRFKTPLHWGYFVYFPKLEYGFDQAQRFNEIFSNIGRIIN